MKRWSSGENLLLRAEMKLSLSALKIKVKLASSAAEERVIPLLTCEGIKEYEREDSEGLKT